MTNLIVAIISTVLIGIAAVMSVFYGGTAYQNAQVNVVADAIMSEANQILQAERMWSTLNNQPDISGMGGEGFCNTGMSMLVKSKALAEWPSFAGTIGVSTSLTNPGPQPTGCTNTQATSAYDNGCYNIGGWYGGLIRTMFSIYNQNYVAYLFVMNLHTPPCGNAVGAFASTTTDTSRINHPMIQVALAINNAMGQVPANANMTSLGLPYPPTGSTPLSTAYDESGGYIRAEAYQYGTAVQSDYCYLAATAAPFYGVMCVFGPS
jgi:hypothetical protein